MCTDNKSLSTLLENATHDRKHSRKPAEAYELIEKRSKGPYLEMFAREARENWERWGLEAPIGNGDEIVSVLSEVGEVVQINADELLDQMRREHEAEHEVPWESSLGNS